MTEIEAAQEELRDIGRQLVEVERRLKSVTANLLLEGTPEVQDTAIEIRSVVDCVLLDSIGPAIRDLRAAAEYSGKAEREEADPKGSRPWTSQRRRDI